MDSQARRSHAFQDGNRADGRAGAARRSPVGGPSKGAKVAHARATRPGTRGNDPALRDTIAGLRRALARLERLAARDGRSIDQQILDCLADCGPLSTSAVAKLIARRRSDVLATLRLMAEVGRISRTDETRTWRHTDD